MNSYSKGILTEYIVCLYLLFKFYKIKIHRYRNVFGEIDIIAKHGKTYVFVEVKYRNNIKDMSYLVTERQRKRIIRTAEMYAADNKINSFRFDVILVHRFKIRHFKNTFF